MSTKKKPTTDGLDELTQLRVRTRALEAALNDLRCDLAETREALSKRAAHAIELVKSHQRLTDNLRDLVGVALRMCEPGPLCSVLSAIQSAVVAERTDSYAMTSEESSSGSSYAANIDGKQEQAGTYVFRASEKGPA